MIKYILLLIVAVFLAQAFIAAFAVYVKQLSNDNIKYGQALQLYFRSNMARYVLVAVCVLILSFIMSDYMDLSLTRADLRAKGIDTLNRIERIQLYFKSWAIGVGAFIEVIAVLAYKAGFKSIIDFGKSKGVSADEIVKPR